MAALTFAEMRDYLHFHSGEAHAHWCHLTITCTGECTDSAIFDTIDGRQVTVTVVLPYGAHWPTVTYIHADGRRSHIADHRQFTAATWEALNEQINEWSQVPDPIRRPVPPQEATR